MSKAATLIVIAGPTAVGKTEVAIKLARELQSVIVSADSRQVYREMCIGTAAPTPEQLAQVPHFLIRHRSVMDHYNVSMFENEALAVLEAQFDHRDVVVMTGGTGLYMDVVVRGIDDLPDVSPALREKLKMDFQTHGLLWLQDEVQRIDHEFYVSTDQKNPARLLRALEVFYTSGLKMSELRTRSQKQRPFKVMKIGLNKPREELNQRISLRVDQMIADGLEEECRALYPYRNKTALKTVGYREMFRYFDGLCTLDDAITDIKTNTRRYAKRQMTWFRRDPDIQWFSPQQINEMLTWIYGQLAREKLRNDDSRD